MSEKIEKLKALAASGTTSSSSSSSSSSPSELSVTFEFKHPPTEAPYRPEDPTEFTDASGARQFNFNNPECAEHALLLLSSEERENMFEIIFSDPEYFLKLINAARINDTTLESILNISTKRRRGQGLTINFKITDIVSEKPEQVGGSPDIPDEKVYRDFVEYARVCLRNPYPSAGPDPSLTLEQFTAAERERRRALESISESNGVAVYGRERGSRPPGSSSSMVRGPDRTASMNERARFMARLTGGAGKADDRDINEMWNSSNGPKIHAGDMVARIGGDVSTSIPVEEALDIADVTNSRASRTGRAAPSISIMEQMRGLSALPPTPAPTPAPTRSPSPAASGSGSGAGSGAASGAGEAPTYRIADFLDVYSWLKLLGNYDTDEIRRIVANSEFPGKFNVYTWAPDKAREISYRSDGTFVRTSSISCKSVDFPDRCVSDSSGRVSRITIEIKTTVDY